MPNRMDKRARRTLLAWPTRTTELFRSDSDNPWLRAQPKRSQDRAVTPRLFSAGAERLATQPDGMWVLLNFEAEIADVICIEVCGTGQNLNDKRSRFMPTTNALHLKCSKAWLCEPLTAAKLRCEYLGIDEAEITDDYYFAIRFLRVLYALPRDLYRDWRKYGVPAGYEFFMRASSLRTFNSPAMQDFLRRMSPDQHFYSAN